MVTAQSFNPVNLDGTPVSDAQMQTLEQAIRYLSQDAEAAVLLKQAADSGVTIKLSREMGGFYDPNTHHIEWNPEFSGGVQDDMDTGYISPAMVLLHEIVHSIDKQRYVEYIELGGSCTVHAEVCHITSNQFLLDMRNSHEKLAVETEQRIARRLGEPIRTTYSDTIGSKTVSSPLHSSREYIRDGKFYQENSQGHTQEADGSVYTKEKTVTYNGQIETRQIDKFDDVFRKVSQSVAVYDHILGTITTTQTDYRTLDADGNSVVTQSVTDLNGNPVQTQSQQQDQAQAKRPFNDPFLDRYYAAIVAGDSQQVDKAALDFAQSTQGQEMAQQGQQLLTEQQAQQQQQQSAPKMVV